MTEFAGHPAVVGVVPGQPDLVVLTAASWVRAVGSPTLYCAYVDPARYTHEEHDDGTVRHLPIDPDGDDDWRRTDAHLRSHLERVVRPADVEWTFRYLAGRVDRALTHLARAVDAAVIIVGARAPGPGARMREVVEGSVAVRLTAHQHRPVLTVPLSVVDWRTRTPW
ncbi:universal stress protein [uncultured Cellulomonas sp.]|uniref:universal stress protein n=1 Tax=uncultured Cellulomonas sp. TaxID=189682 RepID=UPI00261181FF|nr:universal stress protein [uncultured Cellulomonas sp.]